MEAAIVAIGGDPGYGSHRVEVPWGEDKQGSTNAGFETATLGFPIGADGLLLKVYQRVAFLQAFGLHHQFATRNTRCHYHRGTSHHLCYPFVMLAGVVVGGFVRLSADRMAAVALHLYFVGPPQEEKVTEGTVAAVANPDMQAALHYVWQQAAQDGAAWVVMYIGNHRLTVAVIKADRVVVVVIKQWTILSAYHGIVFFALLPGEDSDEGTFIVVVKGFLAQPIGDGRGGAIDRDWSIGGGGLPLLGLPIAGTGGFEGLDDVAEAPKHWL